MLASFLGVGRAGDYRFQRSFTRLGFHWLAIQEFCVGGMKLQKIESKEHDSYPHSVNELYTDQSLQERVPQTLYFIVLWDINPVCIGYQIHFHISDCLIFKFSNILFLPSLNKYNLRLMFNLCKSYDFIILKILVEQASQLIKDRERERERERGRESEREND